MRPKRSALPRRVLALVGWSLAAYAAWLAYAWLGPGWWALPCLAMAHALDGWRATRRRRAPALSPHRPRHLGGAAAQVVGAVALAALVGYRPDWLIGGGLAVSALLRVGDEPHPPRQAKPPPE